MAFSREPYRLTLRHGGRVRRSRFATLEGALSSLRTVFTELAAAGPRPAVSALTREYAPVAQVVARAALKGPGSVRAGMDLRGDASAEAWTGRWSKQVVAQGPGEDAHAALARALS